jgi:hypothetical protein
MILIMITKATVRTYLEYEPEDGADFERHTGRLREVFNEVTRRKSLPLGWIMFHDIMPDVTSYDWRQHPSHQIDGKRPSNHARKIIDEHPRYAADHLAFTNAGELTVYRALRRLQETEVISARSVQVAFFELGEYRSGGDDFADPGRAGGDVL